jgi:protein phosphatase
MNSHQAQWEVGAHSETGYVRSENQDRMSGTQVPLGQLYIVADGMGGHQGGALAAELTVQGLQQYIGEAPAHASVEEAIQTAFTKTNDTVYRQAHAGEPTTEEMGSTAVLLLISGQVARVAHVGDSRAYLYRKGRLKQLTTDHTIVQKMVQAGMLKPAEATNHPNASVLDRAIGSKPSVEVDISDPVRLNAGDAVLLCSDGLSGYVAEPEIASVLQGQATVQEIPERLVKLALQKGGEDNVTVQFIQYGTRQEAQLPARNQPRFWLQMIAAFVLGTAISAGFYQLRESRFRDTESQLQADLQKTQKALDDTTGQLQQAQNDLDGRTRQLEENSTRGKVDKTNIEGKLREVEKEKENLKRQLEDSQKQSKIIAGELADIKKKLKEAQEELKMTKTELEAKKVELKTANDEISRMKPAEPSE